MKFLTFNLSSQGYGKQVMLRGMVEAAVRWMKAGLPLRVLKIVLFSPRVEGDAIKVAHKNGYKATLLTFTQMKDKYDMQYMMPKVKLFKVYPLLFLPNNTYTVQDHLLSQEVTSEFLKPSNIRIS